ncbi:hypothetical protein PAMP_021731 [Pampus punctatissimus]
MEDVVLHYQPGSADGLATLLKRTQKLLEPFSCRPPPVFTPWFPATPGHQLPIRPAKPAPVITSSAQILASDSRPHTHTVEAVTERRHDCLHAPRDVLTREGFTRSWSVFAQKGVLLQSSQSLSKHFHHMVSTHRLHLRQRAKWVIAQHNCGEAADIEQVWRALSRSVRSSRLPTCNANIQRDRAEIWVFCDVLYSEQVGRFLKDELQLTGRISLSVDLSPPQMWPPPLLRLLYMNDEDALIERLRLGLEG